MRIVFMGTPEFAVPSLVALHEAGHDILLSVTQPDRKGNRGKMVFSAVKQKSLDLGIEVAQPFVIRKDEEFMERLEDMEPDMIVVAAFGQILPKRVLDIPKYGCINVHGSLLPKLRGASPMQAAILDGDETSGVTIMQMAEGLDTGDMLSRVECDIRGKNITELTEMLSNDGANLLAETIDDIENGRISPEVQDDEKSSYATMIRKMDGMTDFSEPADLLERKIRAYYEWPTLFTYLDGKQLKIYAAEVVEGEEPEGLKTGTVTEICKDSFTVDCGKGRLKIMELQIQGKKRMKTADFMRGYKINIGDRFTLKEE